MATSKTRFHTVRHDHRRCVSRALEHADRVCAEQAVRLTPLRRRVLEIVWQSHKPLGAYDILKILDGERGSNAPPTVYRSLDFLAKHGLIHRLSSLNAFVGCASPGHSGAVQFLICRHCGAAAELNDEHVESAISRSASAIGFRPDSQVVEIAGICPNCG